MHNSPLFLTLLALLFISVPSVLWAGQDTAAENDTTFEACMRACNHEHTICGEASSTRFEANDMPQGMIGPSAACDQSLKACLKACK